MTMRVRSKMSGGYRQTGGVLLRKGVNDLSLLTPPMNERERKFVDDMMKAGLVKEIKDEAPEAPRSETKLTATALAASDVQPSRPMKRRRAKGAP